MRYAGSEKTHLFEKRPADLHSKIPTPLADAPHIFMVFFGNEFEILDVTQGMCQLLGYEKTWFLGKNLFQLPLDKIPELKFTLTTTQESSGFKKIHNCTFINSEKRQITGDLNISVQKKEGLFLNGLIHLEGVSSNQKAAQTPVENLFQKAAFEIKEPLRILSNFWNIIEKSCLEKFEKTETDSIFFIKTNLQKLNQLLSSLLLYEEITVSKLQKNTINLEVLLLLVQQDLAAWDEKIYTKIKAESLPEEITGHKPYLKILFSEILKNAINFSETDKLEIFIHAADSGKYWEFEIADNGPGIPEEFLKKVFEPLFKMKLKDAVTTTPGMGLAIAKKIVNLHGGRIKAEPNPAGTGTLIRFCLPKN